MPSVVRPRERVTAWRPQAHTHDAWTLLIVDKGAIRYDLRRREHNAARHPTPVLDLDPAVLGGKATTGAAVAAPSMLDPELYWGLSRLPDTLGLAGEEAESRLALIRVSILEHLRAVGSLRPPGRSERLAEELRDLLDDNIASGSM